ncbi:MAG: MarR family transcriptional regulator [Gammaproteobacteria bacterium]|nr:MarR family transcriptional regulator [Gammaproteobacteria bacterium]MBQ0840166.1 MarR family transcriptional regulator [Gammaproteobacteria bacterium]
MIDLADNLVRQIGLLYRAMMKALETETAPLGIGSGRISYMFMLYINEGMTQQEMANRLQADKGAVARTLAQLEEQGYVSRRRDPSDKRVTRVYLTDKSKALQGDLEKAVERVITRLNEDIAVGEEDIIKIQLTQMLKSLSAHYASPRLKRQQANN